MQLLHAAMFVLSIAAGGFLLFCQRSDDYSYFVAAAMYLPMTAAFLLLYFSLGRPQLGSTTAITAASSRVPTEQLLKAAKFVLAIATGGFLLVCQSPMDYPIYAMTMYLLVTIGFLLLYLSLARPHLGSTPATTADDSCVPTKQLLKAAKFVLIIATGGLLLVCQWPMDYPNYAMTMYLMMILGFVLLYLFLARPHLGSTTAADGS
ncbi:hypothetical protein OPV22_034405 [Ensete ventricosum]|uniref:Uncharacterized protein n=1 Tax=Ensete ventricosum TaxID=4639 RepID=A0AAV8PWV3_ENSVE|nr:hypothetical protein OPV22_034405 [Ensete ventricosum]